MADDAPIIITALMGNGDQKWANRLRQEYFPPERNYLDAHVTLFHHLPPQHWPEIKGRLKALGNEFASPPATLSEVMLLGRGVAFRVNCPGLMLIRDMLAEAFHGLLTPQDQARPRLHITVQNKVEPRDAKLLHAELSADFEPRELKIIGLSAHYYRGGPWEAIGDFRFRGQTAATGY